MNSVIVNDIILQALLRITSLLISTVTSSTKSYCFELVLRSLTSCADVQDCFELDTSRLNISEERSSDIVLRLCGNVINYAKPLDKLNYIPRCCNWSGYDGCIHLILRV